MPKTDWLEKWLTPILALALLLAWAGLSLFNHPHTDDFFALKDAGSRGLMDYVLHVRSYWSGRWFPAVLAWLFVNPLRLYDAYWLHTVVWLAGLWGACFFACRQMDIAKPVIASLLATLCLITLSPEPGTALYWFSSAATYTSSLVLWICMFGSLVAWKRKGFLWWTAFLLGISIFLLTGSHEPGLCWLGVLLPYLAWQSKTWLPKWAVFAGIFLYVVGAIILVSAPGNSLRAGLGAAPSVFGAFSGTLFHGLAMAQQMLMEPAFWLFMGLLFWQYGWRWARHAVLLFGLMLLSLLPVLYFSNGSLPVRVYNFYVVSWLVTVAMLPVLLTLKKNKANSSFPWKPLLLMALLASGKTADLAKSYVAGPLHHAVLSQRKKLLESGQSAATITDYGTMQKRLRPTQPGHEKQLVKDVMLAGPPYLHLYDDLATPESRKVVDDYYGWRRGKK